MTTYMHKAILFIPVILLFSGCASLKPTSHSYFDCARTNSFDPLDDKHGLILEILKKAVITDKDIPDYRFIDDKKRIYVVDTTPDNFFRFIEGGVEVSKERLDFDDIPPKIQSVHFCLKTPDELAEIAAQTDDFIYLAIGNVKVDGRVGRIGISSNWQTPKGSSRTYLSGGGYIAEFVKEADAWKFSSILQSWQQ